jgi:ketosteroid isomerase-like protein
MQPAELIDQTSHFLDLLEAGDRAGIAGLLDDQIVWTAPMSLSGIEDTEPARGRAAFGSRLESIAAVMQSVRFARRRITASADNATTFVQTSGDFVTVAGQPYRNVYVFRFDWRDGRIVSWEEYANPIAIIRAFPSEYGHVLEGLMSRD